MYTGRYKRNTKETILIQINNISAVSKIYIYMRETGKFYQVISIKINWSKIEKL